MHTPGACATNTMHPALFLWAQFSINILKIMHLPGAQVPKPMHLTTKLCTHRVQGAPSISNTADTILPLGTEPIGECPELFSQESGQNVSGLTLESIDKLSCL